MCGASKAPATPPPAPVQPPVQAPVLETAQGDPTMNARAAARGRNKLRIDRTQNVAGGAGGGLNIPA